MSEHLTNEQEDEKEHNALVAQFGTHTLDMFSLDYQMNAYLKEASLESDGFLTGLDVTQDAAKELFRDFFTYLTQMAESDLLKAVR